ncbi:hypothetical protein [Acetivibrio saccincola]|jgi:type III secretory pathway component EscV|uniref:Uncharacterized protein n=1 Tax=Acetivibrio saccincola TaxID=1677857 RepID=A0A2K9E721_9FIRM|nr:hypothetical protein [Acetivibrio saccincola]AUG58228.1 hypothetical protein HVS_11695 [Acetivibrio saccincola]NLW26654.1 hypothetical protein [Acetivibrio saccincola]PQQ68104.1 hypothetical protein B9R14_15890 [Acetivibrio saccincola]HOA96667.1 hypothetical protein [Acetivibrio saccincola]HQD27639.1 hypothetical protein [Acetivibrio saccincola]
MAKAASNKSPEKRKRKVQTDEDVKRKAVKLVVSHMKKKVAKDFLGSQHINEWIEEMDELLKKPEFELVEYIQMRKKLNDVIERILDEEMRYKLRDSWYSFGRALDKKAKQQ